MALRRLDLNRRVLDAKYAVRGKLALRAEQIKSELNRRPSSHPFKNVVNLNIGNPQQLDQAPLTFFRQVMALVQYPALLLNPPPIFKQDAVARANHLLKDIHTVGAYSTSNGAAVVRESVARFIERRDGVSSDPEDIFLVAGASQAVSRIIQLVAKSENSGVLVPIPQYPLYSASITLQGASQIGYFLDEADGWTTSAKLIDDCVVKSKADGKDPKLLVVINPGNPTGSVLSHDNIADILRVARNQKLTVLADEVYQTNIMPGRTFTSFKKVLAELQAKDSSFADVSLASVHSTSKGFVGECGQRGGYVEFVNFAPEVVEEFYKLASIDLCPVVTGQVLTELMVNPPTEGDASYPQYVKERDAILKTLEQRAIQLYNAFGSMHGVKCEPPQGAMYLFPQISLPPRAIEAARQAGEEPDEFYCLRLLDETGICVIPGSGFSQKPHTFHFRTTFLAPGGPDLSDRFVNFHNKFFAEYA